MLFAVNNQWAKHFRWTTIYTQRNLELMKLIGHKNCGLRICEAIVYATIFRATSSQKVRLGYLCFYVALAWLSHIYFFQCPKSWFAWDGIFDLRRYSLYRTAYMSGSRFHGYKTSAFNFSIILFRMYFYGECSDLYHCLGTRLDTLEDYERVA